MKKIFDQNCLKLFFKNNENFLQGKWQIKWLDDLSAAYCMSFEMEPEHLLSIYQIFKQHNYPLAKNLLQIICRRCCEVVESEAWAGAEQNVIEDILQCEELNIRSEKQLYSALVTWAKRQLSEGCTGSEIRSKIGSLMDLIRFSNMSLDRLSHLCENNDILTSAEKVKMFASLLSPGEHLPQRERMSQHEELFKFPFSVKQVFRGNLRQAMQFKVSKDIALQAVGVHSVSYLNVKTCDHFKIKIEVHEGTRAISSAKFVLPSPDCSHDSIITLKNPCLLKKNTTYSLSVIHLNSEKLERASVHLHVNCKSNVLNLGNGVNMTVNSGYLGDVFAVRYSSMLGNDIT